ncbi:hypothetical protein [Allonocardiopsis opalescens]|uniref:hypothetical protein n=1 Tax=Allonocardiopsis opalescens TaxID=1144618 RepID=UPI000D080A45|nr:hypothetical protein [Allonocardiopsis opalescens]
MRPGPRGEWGARTARAVVRLLVAAAVGVMAAGFLDWRAGLLVGGLTALGYLLVAVLGPRLPASPGQARLVRALRAAGYRELPEGAAHLLLVGPGGVYHLDPRSWLHQVSRRGGELWIGSRPASAAIERAERRAARLTAALRARLPELWEAGVPERGADGEPVAGGEPVDGGGPAAAVVAVITVSGRLSEPVTRAGGAVVASPRGAVRYLAERPETLSAAQADLIARTLRRIVRRRR